MEAYFSTDADHSLLLYCTYRRVTQSNSKYVPLIESRDTKYIIPFITSVS